MNLPRISGREVVPVRLVPIITHQYIDQRILAGILSNNLNIGGWDCSSDDEEVETEVFDEELGCVKRAIKSKSELQGQLQPDNLIYAYYLHDSKTIVRMNPKEWEIIYRDIKLLATALRDEEKADQKKRSIPANWKQKATEILPPGVFLWRNDLDRLWEEHVAYYGQTQFEPSNFRDGANYNAYIRPEDRRLIWEGFEHMTTASNSSRNKNGVLASEAAESIKIGYSDFMLLCRIEKPAEWVSWLSVRSEGIWLVPPPDDVILTPSERSTLCDHPDKDLTKPLLSFPCSLKQLQSFLEDAGVYGCIDPFDMAGFILEQTQGQLSVPSVESEPKPKSKESLLKIIIAMAVDGYGYDPEQNKSPTPEEITKAVQIQGLSITAETVRKWLAEAAELLPKA